MTQNKVKMIKPLAQSLAKVYKNVVPRNVRLSEAPSHGMPVIFYDKNCPGSKSYINFTEEFLAQEESFETAA